MADDILKVGDKLRFGGESSPELDFLGRANLWIRNFYDNKTIDLARYVIAETLRNSAPGQLSVAGFDGDLTGIFAPFAALAAGESKTLELLLDMKDLEDYLNYLKQHIQAVQNVIQARNDSLIDFRKAISRPIESYILVVLSLDMGVI
ncbi:MAG: hypothetical protein FWF45_05555, partial [Coriobacteriia bacterium]|nr:hypothetical protein [Coriobacteriia bacterium]